MNIATTSHTVTGKIYINGTKWGLIEGDIEDQEDLQDALDAKQDEITSTNKLPASLVSGLATVATSGSYVDLLNKPTIGSGSITISKNSAVIDSFSVNQTTDTAIDIVVPTKTSDISNDSDFTTNAYVNGQLNLKADKATTYTKSQADALFLVDSDLNPYRTSAQQDDIDNTKQPTLISGTNIKTINSQSLLGSGNIVIQGGGGSGTITDVLVNGESVVIDGEAFVTVPDVIDSTESTSTTDALSANMGKELQDQITNLKQRGRYLSVWNCTTGLAGTSPTIDPYPYKAGDYFIVSVTGDTNYRPVGTQYSASTPSTTVETGEVTENDTYYYDGTAWTLLHTEQVTVAFANLAGQPSDNANLSTALNAKANQSTTYTKTEVDTLLADKVDDVKINGTSIVSSGTATIPLADSTTYGVIKDTYTTITILTTDWVEDSYGTETCYSSTKAVTGAVFGKHPQVTCQHSSIQNMEDENEIFGYIYRVLETNGNIIFYASELPTKSITLQVINY